MFTLKHRMESITLLTMAGVMGLFLALSVNNKELKITPTMVSIDANSIESPIPTEIPTYESVVSEISSDGTKRVILRTIQNNNETKAVTLLTEDSGGENTQIIFNMTLEKEKSIKIPYNTWSPDNKYFFIQENSSAGTEIKVFDAKGEPFASGENYLDLTGLFRERETVNSFSEATGWASENLIIVNAATKQNTKVSYWFGVPSKAIIQLSTLF